MKCRRCQVVIPDDSLFCPFCGNKIELGEQKQQTSPIEEDSGSFITSRPLVGAGQGEIDHSSNLKEPQDKQNGISTNSASDMPRGKTTSTTPLVINHTEKSHASSQTESESSPSEGKVTGAKKDISISHMDTPPNVPDQLLCENATPVMQGNLPLMHTNSSIFRKHTGEVFAVCSFIPVTDKPIRAMQVDIICYDVWHERLKSVERFQYNDLQTTRNQHFGAEIHVPLPDPSTRNIDVVVQRIVLSDGSIIQRSADNFELPVYEAISEHFSSTALFCEYKRLTYGNIKYTPIMAGSFWRCTCGAINRDDETSCHKCSDSVAKLFDNMKEETLQASINERERVRKEKEEQERTAREEAERKKVAELRARAEKEAEEARVRLEQRKRRKKRNTLLFVTIAVLAVAVYVVGWQIIPNMKYKKADKLLESGDSKAAYTAFVDLNEYKDSQDRALEIKYADAEELLKSGDRTAAYSAFVELGDYKDSRNRAYEIIYADAEEAFASMDYNRANKLFSSISVYSNSSLRAKEAVYQEANILMADESYIKAAELYESISGYQDSSDLALRCRNQNSYNEALSFYENIKFYEAAAIFESLGSYKDSATMTRKAYYLHAKQLIENGQLHEGYVVLSTKVNTEGEHYEDSIELANVSEYQYATQCFNDGNYSSAAESYANLTDYEDSASRALESKYQYGLKLASEGEYIEAERLFTELGEYKDSAKQVNESIYMHGVSLLEAGKCDDAIAQFELLTNYRDSAKQINEAKYQKAVQLLEKEKFTEAEALFAELGYYSDSANQLKETKYQRATKLIKDKKYKQAVPIFKELGYYSDSVEQWKAAMYTYVLANKNNNDTTTYEYLGELKKYNYKNSKSLYDDLYTWKAIIVINGSENDAATMKSSLSTSDIIYCHFKLEGGPPQEIVPIQTVGYWPGGGSTTVQWDGKNEWRRGDTGSAYFWYDNPANAPKGTFTFKIFVRGVVIGQQSVRLT